MDDREDELEDSDEEDWDGHRGKHDQKKEKKVQSTPLEGKSGGSKQKAAALELVPYSQAPSIPSAPLGSIPPTVLNQYGSNLTVSGDIFPAIAKIITPGRQSLPPCDQIVSVDGDNRPVSQAVEISMSAEEGFVSGGSATTLGKARNLSALEKEEIGWESTSSWETNPAAIQAREHWSKSNADRPSRNISPVLEEVAVHLDFSSNSEAAKVVSPLADGSVVPALAAKVSRAPRSRENLVELARKSAHGQGLTEGSVLDRAIRRSAEKDASTLCKSLSDFSVLNKASDSYLLEVAADCAVLFPVDLGDPKSFPYCELKSWPRLSWLLPETRLN
jgi:hypothetical protein